MDCKNVVKTSAPKKNLEEGKSITAAGPKNETQKKNRMVHNIDWHPRRKANDYLCTQVGQDFSSCVHFGTPCGL